jgi:glyoxylase-like metal-dependent hydrolase (beta-lactamase superfamily II)
MLDIYGLEGEVRQSFEQTLRDEFFYQPHEDIHGFGDDACFDLGGVRVRAMHTPGHTRGHCCFVIDWDDSDERLVYLGDIELTGFGPYYGDAWSDLEDFERSLALIAEVDAHWWLTFHHKGLIEGRPTFLSMLAPYTGMIAQREAKLLAYLAEPHTLADIVEHRFVYRPGTGGVMADSVERRSMGMHLQRMLLAGSIRLSAEGYVVNTKA